MWSRSRTSAGALLLAAALAGCSDIYYDRRESIALHAGDAMASNRVTHMVDPWPRASANRNIAFNGQRMQGAVERHRTHTIIRPMSPMTADAENQPQPPPDHTTEEVKSSVQNPSAPPMASGTNSKP
jgi:hypothetical protein